LLTDHFTRLYARKYNKDGIQLHPDVHQKLGSYAWPGNIRELQHVIERAIILSDREVLKPADFLVIQETGRVADPVGFRMEDVEKQTIQQALEKHRYNISKAAEELGMARTTLYRKMTKYGIS
jgi:transcriptional regulator of acetoin/glycerol metabolism